MEIAEQRDRETIHALWPTSEHDFLPHQLRKIGIDQQTVGCDSSRCAGRSYTQKPTPADLARQHLLLDFGHYTNRPHVIA
jgi:hypothetical protein